MNHLEEYNRIMQLPLSEEHRAALEAIKATIRGNWDYHPIEVVTQSRSFGKAGIPTYEAMKWYLKEMRNKTTIILTP